MSQNLDSYLKAIEQANKVNRSSEKAAELMIGAYRGSKNNGNSTDRHIIWMRIDARSIDCIHPGTQTKGSD